MLEITNVPINFPQQQAHFFLSGNAGQLEVVSATSKLTAVNKVAVICHPHPSHGGTMHNKVVTTLARALHESGLHVVRFNYRGVQQSTGSYDHTIGEADDLLTVLAWIKKVLPQAELCLAGFSFGAYIATKIAHLRQAKCLITVAPPVNHFDFQACLPIRCPWLVLQGDDDEIVPSEAVYRFIETIVPQPNVIKFAQTSHFFHGKLVLLRQQLQARLIELQLA